MMQHCQELCSSTWSNASSDYDMPVVQGIQEEGYWPYLECLNLGKPVADPAMQIIPENMKRPVRELIIQGNTTFGDQLTGPCCRVAKVDIGPRCKF